jgi:hypothetical protein
MTTSEEKALDIIRLIFRGGLSKDSDEAVKQIVVIIERKTRGEVEIGLLNNTMPQFMKKCYAALRED